MKAAAALALALSATTAAFAADSDWIVPAGAAPAREQGKIVLWALPETQAKFGRAGLQAIADAAATDLKELGVGTRLIVYLGKSLSRAKVDALGKLAILGNKPNALALARANGLISPEDAEWLGRAWDPAGSNPEKSDFSASGAGQYTFLGLDACFSFSKLSEGALTPAQAAALFALHGVGHQAGISHPTAQNFNDDGSRLLSMLNGRLYLSDGVAVQLAKRPAIELFRARAFADACDRDDPCKGRQRAKWDAAFR